MYVVIRCVYERENGNQLFGPFQGLTHLWSENERKHPQTVWARLLLTVIRRNYGCLTLCALFITNRYLVQYNCQPKKHGTENFQNTVFAVWLVLFSLHIHYDHLELCEHTKPDPHAL